MRCTCNIILNLFLACELLCIFKRLMLFIVFEGFEIICKYGSLADFYFLEGLYTFSLVM